MTHIFCHPNEVKNRTQLELPLLAGAGLLTFAFPFWVDSSHWGLFLFCLAISAGCMKMSYHILRLMPFLDSEIQIDRVGFTITGSDGNYTRHLWQEVEDARYDAVSQTVVVEDAMHRPLLVVSEQINDFADLEKAIRSYALIRL
ncbi:MULTISPECIES: hypothetical protein [Ferrimonas]|uniref:hypothetical protein n=1 Tax=Ferrimonas TaxID=44011 RepID=UPI0004182D47|nr:MULTISPECIES: hypothetical protein [Ferrimonas]USD39398.1 hypothetical protein J8Z22_10035 [Ferrimonas sp. SCSIO 43195]